MAYVADDGPVMIWPEKRDDPALVAIVTLWGIAASTFENAIRNALPAGALSADGANRKLRPSIARVTGAAVGRGVGFGVGLGVGFGVGFGVCFGVGRAVGAGVGVGAGLGSGVGEALGRGDGVGPGIGSAFADGSMATVGSAWASEGAWLTGDTGSDGETPSDAAGDPGAPEFGAAALQAVTSNPTASSRGNRAWGTAAL